MTAQMNDSVLYKGRGFTLAGISGRGLFNPGRHGLRPVMWSTACYRGFLCQYLVEEGRLYLDTLRVCLAEEQRAGAERGEGPLLWGKAPQRIEVEGIFKKLFDGVVKYEELRAPMPFSGRLLLADGFIEELYVHMGFHPAYKYREVHELTFRKGGLVQERDRSEEMEAIRHKQAGNTQGPNERTGCLGVYLWIARSFRRDGGV